jgi:hypothetical protein
VTETVIQIGFKYIDVKLEMVQLCLFDDSLEAPRRQSVVFEDCPRHASVR